jgi:hypothetical protein
MTDATTERRSHAEDHARDHADGQVHASAASARGGSMANGAAPVRARPRTSPLETSAAERLAGILPVVALLWAGVYWALH